MSYTRGTSTITTNGLIYHLDIPNPLCYHANQSKCYSLIGQTIGEVENNVSYFNESKGCLNFDGINTYITIPNNFTFTTEQTIEKGTQRLYNQSTNNNTLPTLNNLRLTFTHPSCRNL